MRGAGRAEGYWEGVFEGIGVVGEATIILIDVVVFF